MFLLFGCGPKTNTPKLPAPTYGTATITGTIHLIGKPPEMPIIPNRPCCAGAEPYHEETVVTSANGGLANVFVSIEGLAASDGSTLPTTQIDQKNCRFVPHAVALAVGQSLLIRSDDPTMHNVTYAPSNNPPKNFSMVQVGQQATTSFIAAEYIRARCDVHPWMNAWIGVFDNPFFAVSDADGGFHIDRVPAGKYTLVAWQEQYGKISQPITVEDGKPIQMDLDFKVP